MSPIAVDCKEFRFNAAWLDFNGCINIRRKQAIESFLRVHTDNSCRLVLTTADVRYDTESLQMWGSGDRLTAIQSWLKSLGGNVIYGLHYQSSIPMIEIAVDLKK